MSTTFQNEVQRQRRRASGTALGVGALLGGWTTLLVCIIGYDITEPAPLPTGILAIAGTVGLLAAGGLAALFLRAMRSQNARLRQDVAAALRAGQIPANADRERWIALLRPRADLRRFVYLAPFVVLCIVLPTTQVLSRHHNPYGILFWSTYFVAALAVLIATTLSLHRTRPAAHAFLTQLDAPPDERTHPRPSRQPH